MGVATLGRAIDDNSPSYTALLNTSTKNLVAIKSTCPQQVIIVHVVLASGTATTTSIAGFTTGAGAWTLLDRRANSSGVTSEIWIGYNFPVAVLGAGTITFTFSASMTFLYSFETFFFPAPVTGLPANAAVGATGTGTTADPGAITPAVGDLVIVRAGYASSTAPTSASGSPKAFESIVSSAGGSLRSAGGQCCAEAATAHDLTTVIPSAAWAASAVKLTPPAPSSSAALLYKGFDTAALDQGSPL